MNIFTLFAKGFQLSSRAIFNGCDGFDDGFGDGF